VSDEELRRCQVRLKAGQRKALQTNSSRAMQAAVDVLQGRSVNHWKDYDSLIDGVTVADLAGFARRHFQRTKRTQLVVRP
jgi:predicted Zn-dependent peptidase